MLARVKGQPKLVLKYNDSSAVYRVAAADGRNFLKWTQVAELGKADAMMNTRIVYMAKEAVMGSPPHASHTFTVRSPALSVAAACCLLLGA